VSIQSFAPDALPSRQCVLHVIAFSTSLRLPRHCAFHVIATSTSLRPPRHASSSHCDLHIIASFTSLRAKRSNLLPGESPMDRHAGDCFALLAMTAEISAGRTTPGALFEERAHALIAILRFQAVDDRARPRRLRVLRCRRQGLRVRCTRRVRGLFRDDPIFSRRRTRRIAIHNEEF